MRPGVVGYTGQVDLVVGENGEVELQTEMESYFHIFFASANLFKFSRDLD